ncbi:hypothetical protein ON010_g122 [Phytophthora cinnamomi]|nr:hypothetical protein ON010_g122 [Phytophthora cinnamomi]
MLEIIKPRSERKFNFTGFLGRGDGLNDAEPVASIILEGLLERLLGVDSPEVSSSLEWAALRGEVTGDMAVKVSATDVYPAFPLFGWAAKGVRRSAHLPLLSACWVD